MPAPTVPMERRFRFLWESHELKNHPASVFCLLWPSGASREQLVALRPRSSSHEPCSANAPAACSLNGHLAHSVHILLEAGVGSSISWVLGVRHSSTKHGAGNCTSNPLSQHTARRHSQHPACPHCASSVRHSERPFCWRSCLNLSSKPLLAPLPSAHGASSHSDELMLASLTN